MKHFAKILALLLTLAMLLGMLPTVAFAQEAETEPEVVEVVTPEHEAELQADVLGDIGYYFSRVNKRSAKAGESIRKEDYYNASETIKHIVLASDTYVEDSLVESGSGFFWQTTTGITCGYFPEHEYKMAVMRANNTGDGTRYASASACTNYNNSQAGSSDVCLVGPMYSEDESFTEQYGNEAASIASATGGTAWKLINSNATVTNIANAISKCRVVIFDSHGNTDWGYFAGGSDGEGEADNVTQANTSYLLLSTGSGITNADMQYVTKENSNSYSSTFCHAYADSQGNYCIDGTAISNHMSANAPDSILWMAICLGMATPGLQHPLHNRGVAVVYGYSQSVTFTGDYAYEEDFWDKMIAGETVATAAAYMKSHNNCSWDPAYSNYSLSTARSKYCAFPIVVSAQDTYPGQRTGNTYDGTVDAVQTVNSTWRLINNYTVTATATGGHGTVSVSGTTITCTPATGYYVSAANVTNGTATTSINGNTVTVNPSTDCTVNVVFSPKTACTITYYANGSQYSTANGYVGDAVTLPSSATAVTNWEFAGWSVNTVSSTTDKPSYYTPGASYTPQTANPTLYAVYTQTAGGNGPAVTDTITANDLAATSTGYTSFSNVQKNTAVYAGCTAKDTSGNIQMRSKNSDSAIYTTTSGGTVSSVTITVGTGSNTVDVYGRNTAYSSVSDLYGNNPGTLVGSVSSTGTVTFTDSYEYVGIRSNNGAVYLSSIAVTWGGGGTTTYTTSPVNCAHSNLTAHAAVAADCTTAGNSAYWECDSCHAYFSDANAQTSIAADSWIIPANGHNFVNFVCTVCGATQATYTVTYHDCGTTTTATCAQGGSVTLPATGTTVTGYTFEGWVTQQIDPEDDDEPTILSGPYTPSGNVHLYAVYSRVEEGQGGGSGTPETIAAWTNAAWTANNAYTASTGSGSLTTEVNITSEGSGNTDGFYYASSWTANKAVILTGLSTADYTDIELDCAIRASSAGTLTVSTSTDGTNFTQLTTKATSSAKTPTAVNVTDIPTGTTAIKLAYGSSGSFFFGNLSITGTPSGGGDITYYTTNPVNCEHPSVSSTWSYDDDNHWHQCNDCPAHVDTAAHTYSSVVTAPTENAQGYTTYTCTVCGQSYVDDYVPALGTDYTVSFTVPTGVAAVASMTCNSNGSITLPTAQAPEGYTFLGWVTTDYNNVSTAPSSILTGSYTATANVTLKALYTYTQGDTPTNEYEKATVFADGDKVIIYNPASGVAISNAADNTNYRAAVSVTPADGIITPENTAIVWTVEYANNVYKFKDANDSYLSVATSNQLLLGSTYQGWTVTASTTATNADCFNIISTESAGSSGDLRGIEYYSQHFTTYYANTANLSSSADAFGMQLYVNKTGTPYWTTVIAAACEHPSVSSTWSYDDDNHWHQCNDCPAHVDTAAHTYSSVVTAPTENAQGYTTYTCTVCGQSYVGNYVPALGTDYTVSFTVPTGVAAVASMTCNSNGSITLPTAQAPEGYTFLGWVTTDYDNVDTQPGTILTGSYTATGNVTLKALYTYTQGGGEQTVDTWTAVDVSTLTASDVAAIVFTAGGSTYAMSNNNGSSSAPVPVSVTVANGAITGEVAENVKWNIAYSNGTFTVAPNGDKTNKLYCTNTNNGVRVGKETNNTFSIDSESGYIKNTGVNRYLGVYGTQDIRCYTSATADNIKNQSVAFYKLTSTPSGTPYWTTVIAAAHEHTFGEWTSNNDGTHSSTCSECDAVETVDCTYNASGLCTVCGYQLPTYTVSFSVPSGVTAVSAQSCLANGSITLPTANAPEGYTFEGWVTQQIDPEDDDEPAILTGPYTPEASVTLYAVYSRVEEDSGVGSTYNKISSASDITNAGSYVIVSSLTGYAMSTSVDNNWVRIGSTYSGDSITNPTAADVWTINNGVLSCSNGSLYSSAVKKVALSNDNSTTWTFEASGGTFTISDDGNELAYNTSGGWRPYNTEQTDNGFYIYKAGAGSTTYYTTNPTSAAPAHSSTFLEGQAATCEVPGVQDYYYCTDCLNNSNGEHYGKMYSDAAMTTEILDATIPALGHVMVAGTVHAPTCTNEGYTEYACSRPGCNEEDIDDIVPALGHNFTVHPATSDDDHYLAPTCTDAGIEYLQCSRCDEWDEDGQVIAALGHSLTATPANSATCTTAGNSAYWTCSTCGKYFSDAAGTTEIQANSWVIAATAHTSSYVDNGDGTHDEVCSVCDTVLTDDEAHVFDNCVCIGCGAAEPTMQLVSAAPVLNDKIDMVYAAKVPDGYTNPYVVFSFNGVNTTVTEHTTDVNGNLNFVFTDVNPQCMGDNISATLYATKAGTEESVSVTNYSVRQYCVNMLARTGDNAISNDLRTLLSNLLAYGAAAQTYMGYKTNALVNENTGLTNEQLKPSTFSAVSGKDASFEGEASTDVYWLSAGLTLTNSVAMNFSFYAASTDGLTVQLQVGSGDPVEMTYAAVTGKDNVYAFSFTGIDADHFDDVVTVRFYNGNVQVGNALSYSVNSYVQAKQNDAETANLAALVRALYLYGASAAAYSTPASNG